MKKRLIPLLMAACMVAAPIGVLAEEVDYTYLEDMSVKEIRELSEAVDSLLAGEDVAGDIDASNLEEMTIKELKALREAINEVLDQDSTQSEDNDTASENADEDFLHSYYNELTVNCASTSIGTAEQKNSMIEPNIEKLATSFPGLDWSNSEWVDFAYLASVIQSMSWEDFNNSEISKNLEIINDGESYKMYSSSTTSLFGAEGRYELLFSIEEQTTSMTFITENIKSDDVIPMVQDLYGCNFSEQNDTRYTWNDISECFSESSVVDFSNGTLWFDLLHVS